MKSVAEFRIVLSILPSAYTVYLVFRSFTRVLIPLENSYPAIFIRQIFTLLFLAHIK